MSDRKVHAQMADGSEIVRYDRSGKWFHEHKGTAKRERISVSVAALLAAEPGSQWREGVPGGGAFDRRVRNLA